MGIIFVIVIGTLMATMVLFIHSRKMYIRPLRPLLQRLVLNRVVWLVILEPPAPLLELWTEYGIINETRIDANNLDPILLEKLGANNVINCSIFQKTIQQFQMPPNNPLSIFSSFSSQLSATSGSYNYQRRLASITKQYAQQVRQRERKARRRRETIQDIAELLRRSDPEKATAITDTFHNNSRLVKKQKMMRRCSLEWEYLANIIDRCLLLIFSLITIAFFNLLLFFDSIFQVTDNLNI